MLTQFGRKRTGNAFQVIVFMTDGGYTTADPTTIVNDAKSKDGVSWFAMGNLANPKWQNIIDSSNLKIPPLLILS